MICRCLVAIGVSRIPMPSQKLGARMEMIMLSTPTKPPTSPLRVLASLWFAAVILVLLLVALACATVYESMKTSEHALHDFYRAWWFTGLLVLLAINVTAAMIVRYPFNRRQVGFLLTHVGILVTLGGALVTRNVGLDGQLGVIEGQTVNSFTLRDTPTILLADRTTGAKASVDLPTAAFTGFKPETDVRAESLLLDGVSVNVQQYLPDSAYVETVVNDNPGRRPAVEVSLSPTGLDQPFWLFAGKPMRLGSVGIAYRVVSDPAAFARLIEDKGQPDRQTAGELKIEFKGGVYAIPLTDCTEQAAAIGSTGYSVRVVRYLPHASVEGGKVISLSARAVNPAVEVELVGPEGSETRLAFARFPDFSSMHGETQTKDLKLTFVATADTSASAPIEVLGGPDGKLYVRFQEGGAPATTTELTAGVPVASPWSGQKFAVVRSFDRARVDRVVTPVEPVRKQRAPAVLVEVSAGGTHNEVWLQKNSTESITLNRKTYEMAFVDKQIPLGFDVKLDDFILGYYPGGRRPRSFESHITLSDAASGVTQTRVVSMNHPVEYGGFTLYQSSYREEPNRTVSFLSVARDPGQIIAFAGYVIMMLGMVFVLVIRMMDRRRAELGAAANGHGQHRGIDLLGQPERCTGGIPGVLGAADPVRGGSVSTHVDTASR